MIVKALTAVLGIDEAVTMEQVRLLPIRPAVAGIRAEGTVGLQLLSQIAVSPTPALHRPDSKQV